MDTSSPELSDDFHTEKIKCCGTLASNIKAMPMIVGKKIKLKWGNKGTAITMEDEMSTCRETCSFLPTEGNFNNVHGKSLKMATV